MPLLPNRGPPLPKTHEPIPLEELSGHLDALRTAGELTVDVIESIAAERNAPTPHVYAALSADPNLVLHASQGVLLAVCVGACQEQGAIDVLAALLEERKARLGRAAKAFDVVPRSCLDMCAHSPVVMSRSPHGMGAHPKMKPQGVAELAAALCDD